MGFYVASEDSRIAIRRPDASSVLWPHWAHDELIKRLRRKVPAP